jgi:AraC-like DNA-binding protein
LAGIVTLRSVHIIGRGYRYRGASKETLSATGSLEGSGIPGPANEFNADTRRCVAGSFYLSAQSGTHLALTPYVFRKLFVRNVGLTPKRYLRIERFRVALDRLSPDACLSDVAVDARFSDQSHMTREVEHFASMTPGRLRASVRPYVGHVLDLTS